MRKYYNIHYPNGDVKKHRVKHEYMYYPRVDKIFSNGNNNYRIEEMSEEDIWVEFLNREEYYKILSSAGSNAIFTCFDYNVPNYVLIDYTKCNIKEKQ